MQTFTLLGFIAQLETIDRDLVDVGPAIVARACEMVTKQARAAIGREHEMWPALAPSTIADRVSKGYAPNQPRLRTGELRDSIEWTAVGLEGCVGSDSPIAVYQELGTSRIPPRSFLVSSAISMEEKIHRMAARAVVAVLEGRGLHSSEMAELIHLLQHAAQSVKENIVDPLLFGDDGEGENK